jgi:hypothetical protein
MAKRTRRRGGVTRCQQCGGAPGPWGCDGVVSKDPWKICNKAICESCRVHVPGGADYCASCWEQRRPRDPGEEG